LLARYLTTACGNNFTKFKISAQSGTKMNCLNFEVKRSKRQGHSESKYGQISTLEDIFSPLSSVDGHFNETYRNDS